MGFIYRNRVVRGFAVSIIAILALSWVCPNSSAQETSFKAGTSFAIPDNNAAIVFAMNGSYTDAQLVDGAWHFTNLKLGISRQSSNLTVSAKDESVMILLYVNRNVFGNFTLGGTNSSSFYMRFNTTGDGTFTVNFGRQLNITSENQIVDWFVSSYGVVYGLGDRWTLQPDGTVSIHGIPGNVTISYSPTYESVQGRVANASFYEQHSVIITTAVVLAATFVVAAAVVVVRQRKHQAGGTI